MKKIKLLTAVSAAMLTLGPAMLPAKPGGPQLNGENVNNWKFGKTLHGPTPTKKYLKGKVIVVVTWGVKDALSIKALPGLVALDKEFRDKGVVIIGVESHKGGAADVKKITDQAKIQFTITSGAQGPPPVEIIPEVLVFNLSGELKYHGLPGTPGVTKAINEALKKYRASGVREKNQPLKKEELKEIIATREWTNTEGKKISAAVVAYSDGIVTFKMSHGKLVKYKIANLSKADQELIKKAAKGAD